LVSTGSGEFSCEFSNRYLTTKGKKKKKWAVPPEGSLPSSLLAIRSSSFDYSSPGGYQVFSCSALGNQGEGEGVAREDPVREW